MNKQDQHYVPRFYLKFFVIDRRGDASDKERPVWAYEKASREVEKCYLDEVAQDDDFYDFVDDSGGHVKLEDRYYAQLDSSVAKPINRLEEEYTVATLANVKNGVSKFLALQWLRGPGYRQRIETFFTAVNSRPPILENAPDSDNGILKATHSFILDKEIGPLMAHFANMTWQLCEAASGETLCTSDNPVVSSVSLSGHETHNIHWSQVDAVYFLPLTPRRVISLYPSGSIGQFRNGIMPDLRSLTPADVLFLNRLQLDAAYRHVFSSIKRFEWIS
jgi:hypothetical protein